MTNVSVHDSEKKGKGGSSEERRVDFSVSGNAIGIDKILKGHGVSAWMKYVKNDALLPGNTEGVIVFLQYTIEINLQITQVFRIKSTEGLRA